MKRKEKKKTLAQSLKRRIQVLRMKAKNLKKKPEKKAEIPKEEEPVQEAVESDSATSEELLEHVATANYIKKNQQIIKNSTNKRELTAIMEGEQNYNSKMQRSQKR